MRRLIIVTASFLLSLSGSLRIAAQTPPNLSIDEAIGIALEENREIETARLELNRADAQVDEALGNALPVVDVNSRYTWNIQRPVFFFPGEDGVIEPIEIGSKNALTADISVQQILFNSAVLTGVGTSRIYAQISRQALRGQAADVILAVKRAYFGVLLSREVLSVNRAQLENAEVNFRNVNALYEAGLRAEFDALRAEVTVDNLKPRIVQGEDNYRNAIDALVVALGRDRLPNEEISISGEFREPTGTTPVAETWGELEAEMLEHNPQLSQMRLLSDVNRELIEIDRSEYLPTVALFGTWKVEGQADNIGDLDFQPSAFAGINVSLNLYNGGQTAAKVEQSRVEWQQNRFQTAELEALLRLRLRSSLRRIDAAVAQIRAGERTISQAERAYRIATTSYSAGTGTQLQINDADLALAQARLNRLSALHEFNVALAELEHLIGRHVRLEGDDIEYVAIR